MVQKGMVARVGRQVSMGAGDGVTPEEVGSDWVGNPCPGRAGVQEVRLPMAVNNRNATGTANRIGVLICRCALGLCLLRILYPVVERLHTCYSVMVPRYDQTSPTGNCPTDDKRPRARDGEEVSKVLRPPCIWLTPLYNTPAILARSQFAGKGQCRVATAVRSRKDMIWGMQGMNLRQRRPDAGL